MATVLGQSTAPTSPSGSASSPGLDLLNDIERAEGHPFAGILRVRRAHSTSPRSGSPAPSTWSGPTRRCGATPTPGSTATTRSRSARAPSTPCTRPGHTPGHYVFADRADGLLFAGDHVLPTITPSIGFTVPGAHSRWATSWPRWPRCGRCPTCGSCPRTARWRRRRTPGSTSCSRTTRYGSTCASRRSPPGRRPRSRRRRPAAVDPARARLRRPRRLQPRPWPRWRPRRTSSCWWPAVR